MSDYFTWSAAPQDYITRRANLAAAAAEEGLAAVVVGHGADLRYLVGRTQGSHERMSALVVPAQGDAFMITPKLERPGWDNSLAAEQLEFRTWSDGENPYSLVAAVVAGGQIGVDDYLTAAHVLGVAAATGATPTSAGPIIALQRMRKSADEKRAMQVIGAANDSVQARMGEWLQAGRTENEVRADVINAMFAAGHADVDFCIIGSGPNGAKPHHEGSDRVIQAGEPVVVDIGGPAPSGFFSDCTRTYCVGKPVDPEMQQVYDIVLAAQEAGVQAAHAGATCESIDAAARTVITDAGYGEYFITRTGHGIGMECHEHPYMVRGNTLPLEPGMAFSVEPGIYIPGRFGVRIEDIMIIDDDGTGLRLNNCPKDFIL